MGYENHPVYRRLSRQVKQLPAVRPPAATVNISVNDAEALMDMVKELYERRERDGE